MDDNNQGNEQLVLFDEDAIDFSDITITGSSSSLLNDTISLDLDSNYTSTMMAGAYVFQPPASYSIGIQGSTNPGQLQWPTTASAVNIDETGIEIKDGSDIKIGGRSLTTFMEKMEERLAILQPDPEKLENFEALRQAYEHYKFLERLCSGQIPKDPDE